MKASLTTAALLATVVHASPSWLWGEHSHPGWPEPSVYTPEQPSATWSHKPWHHYSKPGATTTEPTGSSTATGGTSASTASGSPIITGAACASVSKLAAAFTSASPSAIPTVPAELAYECLTSIPFNSSAAVAFLDSVRPYLDWQTTISYLKDPPAEYAEKVQAPYDFYANYERIYETAKSDAYSSEYAFGFDVYRCFQRAHDGHFVLYPDSVTEIFSFGRTTPLISVSVDGTDIPEVFVYSDILEASYGNETFTPSSIAQIDGVDSTEWLLNFSEYGSLQDPDALWNNMFYLLAQVSLGAGGTGTGTFSGGGRGRWIYPGPTTTLTFANGTNFIMENFARVLVPLDGITTGEDIYQAFFVAPPGEPEKVGVLATMTSSSVTSAAASSTTSAAATTIPAPGYPSPLIREKNNLNSGYFLEGAGYDDVAVLSVPSFVSTDDELQFQIVNTYTINQAVASNKTKLIIDVSANAGGTILQGYDLFKQIFPTILPYGATRFKSHQAFDLIGEEISYYSGLVPRSLDTNETVQGLVSSAFNYRTDADINYKPFTSWAEKNGPHAYGPGPDNYTSIIRWNLSDVLTPDNSGGIYVSGYLNRSNITTQPFLAENVVIVYDGYCASTCTIFSELMRQQGGVKTIALGGRPNKDIIQAVGGVKGTNDYGYADILSFAAVPFTTHYLHSAAYYLTTALGTYSDLFSWRTTNAVVNARDGLRQGDTAEVPLQFRYEPADCRIFYTPAMAVDQMAAWKTVADTAFNGINHCVAGDLPSSTPAKRGKVQHQARRRMEKREHYEAIERLATSGTKQFGGDSIMIL